MKTFIILSSCAWRGMLQRPHQMARALASLGHNVHFIEPIGLDIHDPFHETRRDSFLSYSLSHRRIINDVSVYQPVATLNGNKTLVQSTIGLLEHLINTSGREVSIITYFPYQFLFVNQVKGQYTLIYDCVDDHNDLTYSYWSSPHDIEYERQLMDKADIILTTSSALYLSKSYGRDNVYLSKNAVSPEDFIFTESLEEPKDLCLIPHPRICYMGAVDKWFDEELFYRLIADNPDKSFVVIGPVREGMLQRVFPNLYILGVKEHANLKNYLSHMDVGIIPFKDQTDLIVNCDPIKLYEYIACGLPVVSTSLPELSLGLDFVRPCSSYPEMNKTIADFVNYNVNRKIASQFISQNSWKKRAEQIVHVLDGHTNMYSKEVVIPNLQDAFSSYLKTDSSPIIESLLGLTYAESNSNKFVELTQRAYTQLRIPFTLRNYILALCVSNQLDQAVETVLNDQYVKEKMKAELLATVTLNENILTLIKLSYCINKKDEVMNLISLIQDQDIREIELAHYFAEIGEKNQALQIYLKYLQHPVKDFSPLFNSNLVILLKELYENSYEKYNELRDFFLKKKQSFDDVNFSSETWVF
jgi:glycosyltransferase involved in cell wall biosynthesis